MNAPQNPVIAGLAKLRAAITARSAQRAAALGVVMPVGNALSELLPTAIFMAVVSLLDEQFEAVIALRYPAAKHRDFNDRITVLAAQNALKDASRLHAIRLRRNSFAHDVASYAHWHEVEALFHAADEELKHLGVIP